MIDITFNNFKLTNYIIAMPGLDVLSGGNYEPELLDIKGANGSFFTKTVIKAKKIVIPFFVRYKDISEYDAIQRALNVNQPQKLTFSHLPDRYFLAIPDGDLDFDDIKFNGKGTLTFIIPDGVAHSTTYKSVTAGTESAEKILFSITNNGNVDAHPIIKVKHNSENGYLGFVNASGALEIGNREEADTENVKQSENLLDYRNDSILSGFTKSTKNVGVVNDGSQKNVGTANTISVWGRQHVQLANRGPVTAGYNSAATLTWDIPNDSSGGVGSLNDYIWWRQVFWLGAANQYGFIKVTASDTNGQFLYGVETYKRSQGLGCEFNVMATDGKGGYNILKRFTFTGSNEDKDNPFNSTRGYADMKRNDDKLQVYWWGAYPVLTIPELKGKKSAKIHVTLGAYGDKPLITHMYLDGILYRKDFVDVAKDIPNRFAIGSTVTINCEDDTVYLDGIAKNGDVVDGSNWLTIPPGNSQLEVYTSSFVKTKPTVTIEFEERWL